MIRRTIDIVLFWVLVVLMGLMTLNVLWQVASRYVIGSPSSFTDELARFFLIWVGLLGSSYVTGKKLHLAIDILPSKLHGRKERNLSLFINTLVAAFAILVMVWGGIKLMYITLTLGQVSAALNVPLGYIYSVLPLSGILIFYYSISNMFERRPEAEEFGKEVLLD